MTIEFLSSATNTNKDYLLKYLKKFALKGLNFRIDEMTDEIEFLFDNPEDLLFDTEKLKESYNKVTSIQNEIIGMNCIKLS